MKVFIHVDADPGFDVAFYSDPLRQRDSHYFEWKSLTSAISIFETHREKMRDSNVDFNATFFLRADEQTKTLYGSFSDIFTKFHDEIHESFNVGWHPHLLRWSEALKCWHQEFQDNEWIQTMLTDCWDNLQSQGFRVEYTKMGWCFHNNSSMKTLSDLGVEADFSALPGARSPGRLVGGSSYQDRYDWSKTKPRPYRPSERNYQSSGALGILEIPQTTYEVRGLREFLYTVKVAMPSYRRFDFSYLPSARRMVPLLLPDLVRLQDLRAFCASLIQTHKGYVTLYLHPSDLLDSNALRVFEDFTFQMVSAASKCDEEISFIDASELSSLYASVD